MFKKTKKTGNSHSHIAFIREDGTGITSVAKGHAHAIENGFALESEKHTHEFEDIKPKSGKDDEEDTVVVAENKALYEEAKRHERASLKLAEESEQFYSGEGQWKKDDKDKLNDRDAPALTINHIEPKIDLLSGYQRQNRQDVKFLPTSDGNGKVADMLTHLVKNICTQNNYEYEETEVFVDGTVTGRGNFHCDIDRDENPEGDVIIERYPWNQAFYGPHEKLDASDCEYIVKTKKLSKAKVEQLWPDKKDLISAEFEMDKEEVLHVKPGEQYVAEGTEAPVSVMDEKDHIDIAKKKIRVIETQRKEYISVPILVNTGEGETDQATGMPKGIYENAQDWPDADVKAVETIPGFKVVKQKKHRIRVVMTASSTLLSDERPDLAMNDFDITPYYAKKRGKRFWGKVETAKDPQREINKRASQMTEILNKMAGYIWVTDDQTFVNEKDRQDFEDNSAKPGFNAKVADISRPPLKIEGAKYPAEIVQAMGAAVQHLGQIMNINPDLQGLSKRADSNIAITERKKQGLIGNEFLFDNLALSKRVLFKKVVANIKKCYSPERIIRVLESMHAQQPIEIQKKKLDEVDRSELMYLLKTEDLMKYDIVISESPWSPSARQAMFIQWLDAAKQGIPVPPEMLVELSDYPDKDKALGYIQQMMQQKQQAENAKNQTEIVKTQIAHSSVPGGQAPPAGT